MRIWEEERSPNTVSPKHIVEVYIDTHILHPPPNHNLRRCLAILLPQRPKQRFIHPSPMRHGTIRLDDDIAFLQPIHNLPAVTPRMQLVLSNIDLATVTSAADVFLQFVEMVHPVVGHSD